LVRLLQSFTDLRVLLKCISAIVQPLFWSMVMMLGFLLMFAIALVQQMTGYLIDHAHQLSEQEIKDIKDNFGSVQQCIFVLFSGTTGGHDWGETYSIVETAGPITSGCYTLYIGVVGLAITNVITSIFVDKAIRIASPGLHEQMMLKRREDLDLISDLRNLFSMIDVDTSLTISRSELLASLSNIKVASYFELQGLDIRDAEAFLDVLTTACGQDEIDIDTFILGFLCMKGPANHVDVVSLAFRMKKIYESLTSQLSQLKQDIVGHLKACREMNQTALVDV